MKNPVPMYKGEENLKCIWDAIIKLIHQMPWTTPFVLAVTEPSFSLHLLYRTKEFAILCVIGLVNWHQDVQDSKEKREQGISHSKPLEKIVFFSTIRGVNLAKWI